MTEEVQSFTTAELLGIFEKIEKAYPNLVSDTSLTSYGSEMICGEISEKISHFLSGLGLKHSYITNGTYKGRGTEFSGGNSGTSHCWVEMLIKLKDVQDHYSNAVKEGKVSKIIIDGAYAQFFPKEITTKKFRDRVRLMFFINDPMTQ